MLAAPHQKDLGSPRDVGVCLADLVALQFLGRVCLAAGRSARVGAKFVWHLSGDLDGLYVMHLTKEKLGVEKASRENAANADGLVEWELTYGEANAFIRGQGALTRAIENGSFELRAPWSTRMKFIQALRAFAAADLGKMVTHPEGLGDSQKEELKRCVARHA